MLQLSRSRSKIAPPLGVSIPRLRSLQPPAHANPCCTACPSHPPESVAKMESAFTPQENPLRLAFRGICSSRPHQFRYRNTCRLSQILVPQVSSEKREYLPVGLLGADVIITHLAHAIYDPTLVDFS